MSGEAPPPNPDVKPAPLHSWEAYERYIDTQLRDHPPTNANLPGLRCKKSSYFDPITQNLKQQIQYRSSQFDRLADGLADLFMPSGKKGNETSWPSLVPMLQSDEFTAWPTVLTIKEQPFHELRDTALDARPKNKDDPADTMKREQWFTNSLLKGTFDKPLLATTLPSKFEETYEQTVRELFAEARRRPVCLQVTAVREARIEGNQINHTIGVVLYPKGSNLVVAIYDPIYHFRQTSWYVWPMQQTYYFFRAWSATLNQPVELLNLGEYCLKGPKGVHCLQYIIDAAYCTSFVLHFFYLYAKHGCPTTEAGLQRVVSGSFLVPPAELRRDPCKATNEFRLRSIAFLMATLLHTYPLQSPLSTGAQNLLYQLQSASNTLREETGVELLSPTLQEHPAIHSYEKSYGSRDPFSIFMRGTPPPSPRATGGGTRRASRRYRASKKARTRSK